MSIRKPKPAKPLGAPSLAYWLVIARERIQAGEPERNVLADYGYVPEGKPPLAVFKAWANRWQGKVGHSVYWTRDEARLAAGPGSKPVRVRVTVEGI